MWLGTRLDTVAPHTHIFADLPDEIERTGLTSPGNKDLTAACGWMVNDRNQALGPLPERIAESGWGRAAWWAVRR